MAPPRTVPGEGSPLRYAPVLCPDFGGGQIRGATGFPLAAKPTAVHVEPPTLEAGAPESTASLIAALEPWLLGCYEQMLCQVPTLKGEVELQFYIDHEGDPAMVSVSRSSVVGGVADCMARVVEHRLQFPKVSGKPPLISFRSVLTPAY